MDITRIDIYDVVDHLLNLLGEELVSEKMKGSGWKVRRIPTITINVYEKRPARGASYIPTPSIYNYPKNGLINIRNDDQCCFKWCMKYHRTEKKKHDDRITVLKKIEDKYNWTGLSFPVSFDDITLFEDLNNICINVYG